MGGALNALWHPQKLLQRSTCTAHYVDGTVEGADAYDKCNPNFLCMRQELVCAAFFYDLSCLQVMGKPEGVCSFQCHTCCLSQAMQIPIGDKVPGAITCCNKVLWGV